MNTFQCNNCGFQMQRPTQPYSCPQCGRQAIGLFRLVGYAPPAQGAGPPSPAFRRRKAPCGPLHRAYRSRACRSKEFHTRASARAAAGRLAGAAGHGRLRAACRKARGPASRACRSSNRRPPGRRNRASRRHSSPADGRRPRPCRRRNSRALGRRRNRACHRGNPACGRISRAFPRRSPARIRRGRSRRPEWACRRKRRRRCSRPCRRSAASLAPDGRDRKAPCRPCRQAHPRRRRPPCRPPRRPW